ncbi:MAG: hypothetical protein WC394_00945 [Candidatus Omnitrophota bacterium]|jgi:hypothetical protein
MKKRLFLVVMVMALALLGCASSSNKAKENHKTKETKKIESKVVITGKVFVNPVQDYTAGRMLSNVVAEDIYSEISGRIKSSGKYELTNTKLMANYVLDIKIIEIAKGSKAVPFWVGAVSYPARLIFTCEILDASGNVLDTLNYHTTGRGFARISDEEIAKFKEIIVNKICEWLKINKI